MSILSQEAGERALAYFKKHSTHKAKTDFTIKFDRVMAFPAADIKRGMEAMLGKEVALVEADVEDPFLWHVTVDKNDRD